MNPELMPATRDRFLQKGDSAMRKGMDRSIYKAGGSVIFIIVFLLVSSAVARAAGDEGEVDVQAGGEVVAGESSGAAAGETAGVEDAAGGEVVSEWELIRRKTLAVREWDAARCRAELEKTVARLAEIMEANRQAVIELNQAMKEARDGADSVKPLLDEIAELREKLRVKQMELNRRLVEVPEVMEKGRVKEEIGKVWQKLRTLETSLKVRLRELSAAAEKAGADTGE